ncbi:MAG: hypothetical protein CMM76_16365 [Rhodospirillaceae bacterium]|nr:hypothetical protein [Rhodospirillaceae bacterium]MBE91002.1 hypothetical protein [Rhodospirillaceae bacterium]|tara:strand:- start:841 stop:1074 length:234 start_codon:yes stop_codon:yes gene_type:complete
MSSYTPSYAWSSFDSLPSGNPNKIVKATAIGVEMTNIQTAVNSKADSASPSFTGSMSVADLTVSGSFSVGTIDGGTY